MILIVVMASQLYPYARTDQTVPLNVYSLQNVHYTSVKLLKTIRYTPLVGGEKYMLKSLQ